MIGREDREFVAEMAAEITYAAKIGEAVGADHLHVAICTHRLSRLVAITQAALLDVPVTEGEPR